MRLSVPLGVRVVLWEQDNAVPLGSGDNSDGAGVVSAGLMLFRCFGTVLPSHPINRLQKYRQNTSK
jgi:hypothetical protein